MRDLTQVNSEGVAKSRGYGFVAFNDHQHALNTLRKLNNNPDIFTDQKVNLCESYLLLYVIVPLISTM